MDIRVSQHGQVAVVAIQGSVDALTAEQVTSSLGGQIQGGYSQIVADISQVEYMSSAGLRAILATLKESRQHGGDLRLAGPQPGVDRILKLSGFNNILKIYSGVGEAVQSFSEWSAHQFKP